MKLSTVLILLSIFISCDSYVPSTDDLAVQFAFYSIIKNQEFHPIMVSGNNYISIAPPNNSYFSIDKTGYSLVQLDKPKMRRIISILPFNKMKYKDIREIENQSEKPINHECNFIITDFYKDNQNNYLISIVVEKGFWVEYKISLEKGLFMIIDEDGGVF